MGIEAQLPAGPPDVLHVDSVFRPDVSHSVGKRRVPVGIHEPCPPLDLLKANELPAGFRPAARTRSEQHPCHQNHTNSHHDSQAT